MSDMAHRWALLAVKERRAHAEMWGEPVTPRSEDRTPGRSGGIVVGALAGATLTAAGIAAATGLTMGQVRNAVHAARKHDLVETVPVAREFRQRGFASEYRLTDEGRAWLARRK